MASDIIELQPHVHHFQQMRESMKSFRDKSILVIDTEIDRINELIEGNPECNQGSHSERNMCARECIYRIGAMLHLLQSQMESEIPLV